MQRRKVLGLHSQFQIPRKVSADFAATYGRVAVLPQSLLAVLFTRVGSSWLQMCTKKSGQRPVPTARYFYDFSCASCFLTSSASLYLGSSLSTRSRCCR